MTFGDRSQLRRRRSEERSNGIFRLLLKGLFGVFFVGHRIVGKEHLASRDGGAILACNHISNLDPVLLTLLPRKLSFMAKKSLRSIPVFGWCMDKAGHFTINRGVADSRAIRTALARLEQGEWVGVFPEGTRSRDGQLRRGKAGTGMLAWKAQVPVIPACIAGSDRLLPRGKFVPRVADVVMTVGPPVPLDDLFGQRPGDREAEKALFQEVADRITVAIADLSGQALPEGVHRPDCMKRRDEDEPAPEHSLQVVEGEEPSVQQEGDSAAHPRLLSSSTPQTPDETGCPDCEQTD